MWFVIQTMTGKEADTVDVIDRILKKNSYERCFVIQRECIWRIEGRCRVHLEPLFPSYIFVETDTPEEFFFALKRVPKLTKLLGSEGTFCPVERDEVRLLQKLLGDDEEYVVRRSPVEVNSDGEILSAGGVLKEYVSKIVKKRLRKRVVVVEIPFLGKMRRLQLGVRLAEDGGESLPHF